MKVKFRQTGGMLGATREYAADSATMPAKLGEHLAQLVRQSDFAKLQSKKSAKGRDAAQYEVTVETPEAAKTIAVDDASAPEDLWPLLEFLMNHARPVPVES